MKKTAFCLFVGTLVFKGRANGIAAGAGGTGTDADAVRGTVALPVVVNAILHAAGDAANVIRHPFVFSVVTVHSD